MSFIQTLFRPQLTSLREIRRYVVAVTGWGVVCMTAAWTLHHLIFPASTADGLSDLLFDVIGVVAFAVPLAFAVARAQLQLYLAKRKADEIGRTDALTGLSNRRAFYEAAARREGEMTLAIIDIDRFKRINDRYGHPAGDEVIRRVGALLREAFCERAEVARVGGEEFALLLQGDSTREIREGLARVRSRLAAIPVVANGLPIQATLSAGLATRARADFQDIYAAADRALYAAKATGRDCTVDVDEIGERAVA